MENIQQYAGDSIVMTLVGNKIDLRGTAADAVTPEEGEGMAKQFSGVPYMECSALTGSGFEHAVNNTTLRIMERQARGEVVQISADRVTAAQEAAAQTEKKGGRRRSSTKKDCTVM